MQATQGKWVVWRLLNVGLSRPWNEGKLTFCSLACTWTGIHFLIFATARPPFCFKWCVLTQFKAVLWHCICLIVARDVTTLFWKVRFKKKQRSDKYWTGSRCEGQRLGDSKSKLIRAVAFVPQSVTLSTLSKLVTVEIQVCLPLLKSNLNLCWILQIVFELIALRQQMPVILGKWAACRVDVIGRLAG